MIKAGIVEKYLKFFNTALKDQPFQRIYIDAFAGSGAFRYVETPTNTLFGPPDESEYIHAGSAHRALRVDPPFDRIIFIEENSSNVAALEDLIRKSGHKGASVEQGDANKLLRELCQPDYWRNKRGVIFLDPFGMHVEWSTLKIIAATKALDVWFLFALAGTVRNLPRVSNRLDAGKRAAVTRVLGTDEWFDEFYRMPEVRQSFFDTTPIRRRTATVNDIEAYVRDRLLTIFPYVELPKRLKASGNKSLFSLFFAVSNPNARAIELARKGASHILKNV